MRKQLIILFAVLLAVFLAIGCTSTDTQDQPTENQTTEDQTSEEDMVEEDNESMDDEENMTEDNESMDDEENMTEDNESMDDEENMTEDNESMDDEENMTVDNESVDDEEMMVNDTLEGEEVTITEDGFDPFDVQITVGDTVTWTNEDDRAHTINDDEGVFNSGELQSGESYSYTFEEAGTFTYGSEEDTSFEGMVTVVTSTGETDTGEDNTSEDVVVVPSDA
ncbi:hypothetical protein V7O62_12455 [Methanolobus sp. ZRKC2]|uniref:cupredoxin domain-containing protein n=1 Tax=Methanolobus sp. ZRKC2 TaxID=3125783 RepID=UPI0032431E08